MIYTIKVLSETQLDTINEYYKICDFVDGSITGSQDKSVKWNEQIQDLVHGPRLCEYADTQIKKSEQLNYVLVPRATTIPMFLKYTEGMHYKYHNDFYCMNEVRTDYSLSIFLNDPDEYEGGELVLNVGGKELEYKPPAGSCVAYPTGVYHKVNEVTSGERRVMVIWMESVISDSRIREIINDYSMTIIKNYDKLKDVELVADLERTRYQLIREYAQF